MLTLRKPYFLGIDFGMSHIKAVELTMKNDRPYLVNYGEIRTDFSENGGALASKSPEEKIDAYLDALLKRFAPKANAAHVAMPGFSGLITLIELPNMSKQELEQAIRFEAHKYIPSPLEEVALSWDIVSGKAYQDGSGKPIGPAAASSSEKLEVLLVAALHKEVEKYERYLQSVKLKMEMLELETFSLVRSLVSENDGNLLIIDIGSRAANLVLVEDGLIKVNRNLNAGGQEITTTLSDALNISWERADAIKMGNKDFLNNRETAIVFPSLELIVNESRRVLAAYKAKNTSGQVDHIMLSGGVSKMKGIDVYFAKALGIPVSIGDPWKKVVYDERLEPIVSKLGASYSVAIGLALSGVESYERS